MILLLCKGGQPYDEMVHGQMKIFETLLRLTGGRKGGGVARVLIIAKTISWHSNVGRWYGVEL